MLRTIFPKLATTQTILNQERRNDGLNINLQPTARQVFPHNLRIRQTRHQFQLGQL
jgi:hypothetical protein